MNFLEKLDSLMKMNNLNKNTLSKACDIPYTTIDGWYKKGYKGLKLTTLRKLSSFFNTTLDFWVNDTENDNNITNIPFELKQLTKKYNSLSEEDQILVQNMILSLAEKRQSETSSEISPDINKSVKNAEAEYIKNVLNSAQKKKISSASSSTKEKETDEINFG